MSQPKTKGISYLLAKKGMTRKQAKQQLTTPNMDAVRETLQQDKNWSKVAPTEKESTTLRMGGNDNIYSGQVYDKFRGERLKRESQLRKTIAKVDESNLKSSKKKADISQSMKAVYKDRKNSGDQSTSTCMVGEDPKCKKGADISYKSGGEKYNYKTSKKALNQDIRNVRRGTASNASLREQALKDRTFGKRETYATAKEVNSQKAFGYAMKRLERLNAKKQ